MQINVNQSREINRNCPEECQPTKTQILIVAIAITLLALIVIKSGHSNPPPPNPNVMRKAANCRFGETVDGVMRDFAYYKNMAEKGDALSQYCFAKMYETGTGIAQNLEEARNWYKKASQQELTSIIAYRSLCQPHMFEEKASHYRDRDQSNNVFKKYAEFIDVCCPPLDPKRKGPLSAPPRCPWN